MTKIDDTALTAAPDAERPLVAEPPRGPIADPREAPKAAGFLAAAGAMLAGASPLMAQSTAAPGPGAANTNPFPNFQQLGISGQENFDTFGCKVWKGSPATPDWRGATAYFERVFYENNSFRLPDGRTTTIWGFEDTLRSKGRMFFPSPMIRVTEGEMVHTKFTQKKGTHTIHHHGIEPTTMNDGVGHVSFEVEQTYIYQWQPRHAGTWFYHCHKNTPLHFEYGMYGLLIVDPPRQADGRRRAFKPYGGATPFDPVYDVEAFWVADDIDPRWHTLQQEAGLCGEDAGLNIFRPSYFFITGVANTQTLTNSNVAVNARHGQKVLVRLLNASYSVLSVTFPTFDVEIIAVDGHSLGGPDKPWNRRFKIPKGQAIQVATAQRYDIYIDTAQLGLTAQQKATTIAETVRFEFQDWVTRRVHNATSANAWNRGIAETRITLRPA